MPSRLDQGAARQAAGHGAQVPLTLTRPDTLTVEADNQAVEQRARRLADHDDAPASQFDAAYRVAVVAVERDVHPPIVPPQPTNRKDVPTT